MFLSRFIDPTTDFGFKRLFGQEDSKEILISFLNAVLARPRPIVDLSYIPNEQLPGSPDERVGIYDVYCTDTTGARFIVEMQRNRAGFSMDRALYYVTFPISQMVEKGQATAYFTLLPIYSINVLSFEMDSEPGYIRRVQLANAATGKTFYDKLTFVFIELPKFRLSIDQVDNVQDKWLYLLQTMPAMDYIPEMFAEMPFAQAFEIAEQAALSPEERYIYEGSLKQKQTEVMIAHNARTEGRAEGLEEGRAEGLEEGRAEGRTQALRDTARAMLAQGLDVALITNVTQLSDEELAALRKEQR